MKNNTQSLKTGSLFISARDFVIQGNNKVLYIIAEYGSNEIIIWDSFKGDFFKFRTEKLQNYIDQGYYEIIG